MSAHSNTARAQYKADLDAQTKLAIAEMSKESAVEAGATKKAEDIGGEISCAIGQFTGNQEMVAQSVQMLAEAISKMSKPKRRELIRGPDGRAAGVVEIEIED